MHAVTRIVLMEDYLDCARALPCVQKLARRAELTIYTTRAASRDELKQRLAQADIVITIRDRVHFDAPLLGALPQLKLLSVCGPRVAPHIDMPAAAQAGIVVCTSPKSDTPWSVHYATAEMTWGLILALAKDIVPNAQHMRAGGWQTRLSRDLYGKTLGVVGLGKIGVLVAQIARCMQMRVLAWGPRLTAEIARAQGVEHVSFDQLFEESDVVSLHANLTTDSQHLVGMPQFERMKPSALLINTARAGLVDEQALRHALDNRMIAAAALDVFWQEPLPEKHWVRDHPDVLIQPHVGGFSEYGYRDLIEPAVENVLAYLDGNPTNIVNEAG